MRSRPAVRRRPARPLARRLVAPPRRLRLLLRQLGADTSGAVAVIVAIMAPVLIGAIGLGTEVGYWYLAQRTLQNAADVAAYGAAVSLSEGADQDGMEAVAAYLAGKSDVTLAAAPEVDNPPTGGAFAGNTDAVRVTVTEELPRLFTAIFDDTPVVISAAAVALGARGETGCALALSTTVEPAFRVTGGAALDLAGCALASNGPGVSVEAVGPSTVAAACIHTVGTVSAAGPAAIHLDCAGAEEGADPVDDPFAAVPEPAITGPCDGPATIADGAGVTLTPSDDHPSAMASMRFCDGLAIAGPGEVELDPGLYIVEGGDLALTGGPVIRGDGVTIYLAPGVALDTTGGAGWALTPPTGGVYAGITLFASRGSTGLTQRLEGGAGAAIDGTIYAPTSALVIGGGNDATAARCTQLVVDTITFAGGPPFAMTCPDPAGATIRIGGQVALVE